MTESSFVSSVPGIYSGLLELIRKAAEEQSKTVSVFEFELAQYEPAAYVIVGPIKGPRYEWESIPLQMREVFDICGKATVFSGDSPGTNTAVAVEVLTETFAAFQSCVMTPALENRGAPTFGTAGPSAQIVLPLEANYDAGLDIIAGQPGGWGGVIEWALHFEAVLNPVPYLP
jgi:hypothetical protein